jgi:UDP-3-O-[3-hydroxymyristoyl] glucosamine N-acyltransferase
MTLGELIEQLGGRLTQGSPTLQIAGVEGSDAASAYHLVFAEDAASAAKALASAAGALVAKVGSLKNFAVNTRMAIIEADQPRLWFAKAAKLLKPAPQKPATDRSHHMGADVKLGKDVFIGAGAVIGDHAQIGARTRIEAGAVLGEGVVVGDDCRIYPRAVLYPGTTLGNRATVHAGAVLGADGFGYVRDTKSGAYTQFPQQGTLLIEDDVEIGANSTIDRGALKQTRIGRGTKIDNLVHIGHNCDIGEDVILVMGTGISGSSNVGSGSVLAGQVGIGDHVTIGPGIILGGQAGVFSGSRLTNEGVKPGTVFYGTPARPLRQVLREQATLSRLAKKPKAAPKD